MDFRMEFPTETVTEGKVKVLVPKLNAFVKSPSEYAPSKAPVFYNPVMELNRDLAVLTLQAYQQTVKRKISVCEPLAGCGIRGIRFVVEVEGVQKVLIGDINENASKLANYNVQVNNLGKRVIVKNEDANHILARFSASRKRFDAIDIDPFGSPVPYLDSALRALRNNGFLALTATDLAPLCGVHPKACVRKYGGKPLRTEYCHELAVRLLAGCLATTAAKQNIGIHIVFSHSAEHYIRVYATIKYGAEKADESLRNMGYVLHCFNCFHRETIRELFHLEHSGKCSECGSRLDVAGPLWIGKLSDKKFCQIMIKESGKKHLANRSKVCKLLELIEAEAEAPLGYYVIDKICDKLNLPAPSVKRIIEILQNEGFQACATHFNSRGIRTNASALKIREILQEITG